LDHVNLKGDAARIEFINRFKEVQRLKTQLDQYTDLDYTQKAQIDAILPQDQLLSFRSTYLETAQRLKAQQDKGGGSIPPEVQQLDFEFVLFASAVIDYDYIMALIARYASQTPGKQKMSREQLIGLIQSDAKFMDERDDIAEYIGTLETGKGLDERTIRDGFERFKAQKHASQLAAIADKHRLETAALQTFVDKILRRMIFDGEALSELFAAQELGWKARTQKELALMEELIPLLKKLAQGREISGLGAYEQ
jgi:type I restriction enzyme R subunit